ncbi:LysR family transcriptional regulator [Streptomyces sp. DSM 42041]|uniref:LysR family transcriptional regulator n=1 Tax=Streptomyces hazeniae TaxID=3075538 RepID=A0ABU2NNY8_9ACTN|nr:LysR family transcriptional regulator [Streptomyces sp. DSM 42041]MDT0378172.1 LysR family transcriptional regulator [Streptomyces sp. DSM 42041]
MLHAPLDVTRLRLLAEVVRHGSMTAAAEALAYTPSAVSQQIRRLEAELGQPLLDRHARGVRPTEAGRVVVEQVTAIERSLDVLQERLSDLAGLRDGSLRLGAFPTLGSSLLPLAVTAYRGAHPGVRLSVHSARLAQLLEMLDRRRIELAFLWEYEWSRIESDSLDLRVVTEDPTALVVSEAHRLADRTSVDVHELAEESWIIRGDNHPVAEVLSRTAEAAGFEPSVSFEANDYQEAQAMVAVGLGIALAPRLALANLRTDVRVLRLDGYAPPRRILLARLASRVPTPAEEAMTDVILEVGRTVPGASGPRGGTGRR